MIICHIFPMLSMYFLDLRCPRPNGWKHLQYCGIPKEGKITDIPSMRWIGKSAVVLKWYLRAVLNLCETKAKPCSAITVGFRKGAMVEDIIGLLNEMFHQFFSWGSTKQIWLASLNIKTAFELLIHAFIPRALSLRGLPAHLIAVILRVQDEKQAIAQAHGLKKLAFLQIFCYLCLDRMLTSSKSTYPIW